MQAGGEEHGWVVMEEELFSFFSGKAGRMNSETSVIYLEIIICFGVEFLHGWMQTIILSFIIHQVDVQIA